MSDVTLTQSTPPDGRRIVDVRDLVVKYGEVTAVSGVSLQIKAGEFLTLLGPSGCGKTTILRAIAGLERPTSGTIEIDGRIVYSSKEGIDVPAESRNMSMVFQSYAIWPHMTVFENVVYGLRVRRRPKDEIRRQGEWALNLVQMSKFADRRASALSGGQQQRIALARAIAFSPDVILFDEPLSNLDANLRAQMRVEIKELQSALGVTSVYVTHDQEEALTMSDRIIVMSNGEIQQEAVPSELYDYPVNRFVANFIGSANLYPGTIDESSRSGQYLNFVFENGDWVRAVDNRRSAVKKKSLLAIRSVYPQLRSSVGEAPTGNAWPAKVLRATFSGEFIEYLVETNWGEVIVRRPPTERYAVGDECTVAIDPQHCIVIED